MLFTEARFVVFFAAVMAIHWSLRSNQLRKWFLLGASYVFYASWDWRFLSILVVSTTVDFVAGGAIARTEAQGVRKAWMGASLACNLGILGVFKYYNFFAESAADLLRFLGFEPDAATLSIVLPVGISFYTFQALSYTIDIYRRELRPAQSFLDYSLFIAFFPQLVAGPIVRAREFLPQLDQPRRFARHVELRSCLTLFLVGYLKKAVLADQVAMVVDPVFGHPDSWSTGANVMSLLLYSVQIYGDFSGYTDMAIASAGLLGYRLPINFYFPYLATNISEFWQRWHISMMTWMRDYVFVSLDRSFGGMRAVHLVITFIAVGFWHGGSYNMLLFGLAHGLLVVAQRGWTQRFPKAFAGLAGKVAGNVLTMASLAGTLVFFRTQTPYDARAMVSIATGLKEGGTGVIPAYWLILVAACLACHGLFYVKTVPRWISRVPDAVYSFGYGATWALALTFAARGYQPFIYFQF